MRYERSKDAVGTQVEKLRGLDGGKVRRFLNLGLNYDSKLFL